MFIDADAHVDECTETWSYFPKSMIDARPAEMVFVPGEEPRHLSGKGDSLYRVASRGLLIDGQLFRRGTRNDEQTQTTADTRELRDVPLRLKHMDELGIEMQVLYPGLLHEVTQRPEIEIAICESYNRWVADRCAESNGRLRWNAVLPCLSIPDALKEMRRVKEAGATGIFKRGFESGERRAGASYFHPLYELAQELDLPISFHTGGPYTGWANVLPVTKRGLLTACFVQDAFVSLLTSGTCAKFPRLRFGFIEAASGWVPWALYASNYAQAHRATSSVAAAVPRVSDQVPLLPQYEEILAESRMFITCEAAENLLVIVGEIGDNNLCIGTDYSHSDRSAVLYGHREVIERADLSQETKKKITDTNGRLLYGLPGAA